MLHKPGFRVRKIGKKFGKPDIRVGKIVSRGFAVYIDLMLTSSNLT